MRLPTIGRVDDLLLLIRQCSLAEIGLKPRDIGGLNRKVATAQSCLLLHAESTEDVVRYVDLERKLHLGVSIGLRHSDFSATLIANRHIKGVIADKPLLGQV